MAKEKTPSISDLLQENREVVSGAESLYSKLNQRWQDAEDAIVASGILMPAAIQVDSQEFTEYLVGIEKVQGKWRICYGSWDVRDPDMTTNWNPIIASPLHVRLNYLAKIPDLIKEVIESNKRAIKSIDIALDENNAIHNALVLETL